MTTSVRARGLWLVCVLEVAACGGRGCRRDPRAQTTRELLIKIRVAAEARHDVLGAAVSDALRTMPTTDGPCPIALPDAPLPADGGVVSAVETMIPSDPLGKMATVVERASSPVSPAGLRAKIEVDHLFVQLDGDAPNFDDLTAQAHAIESTLQTQPDLVVVAIDWVRPRMGAGAFDVVGGRISGHAFLFHDGAIVCAGPVDVRSAEAVETFSGSGAGGILGAANTDLELRAIHAGAVGLRAVKSK